MSGRQSNPEIKLYGVGRTRSARCLWTAHELGLPVEFVDDGTLIRSDKLRAWQPLAKLPVALIDGTPVFESAAICTYFCDLMPDQSLLAAPGTLARAQHDQWTSFALTELEAYLWLNAKHGSMYPEDRRVPDVIPQNDAEIALALEVLDSALAGRKYLLGAEFSVTDIIVGWTINWARRTGHLDAYANLQAYVRRLLARPLCQLNAD